MYRIVFAADEKFFDYLAVTIQSVIEFSDPAKNYIVSILADNFSNRAKGLFYDLGCKNVKIELVEIQNEFEKIGVSGLGLNLHWSSATYYRILIPFLFEGKILYVDSDTIIQDDISKIFDLDLGENEIGAVIDFDTECYKKKRIEYIKRELKMPDYKKYFNAGVILFNLDKINKETYLKEFLELSKRKFEFLDQDILNIIFKNKVQYLPCDWNFQYHILFKGQEKNYSIKAERPKIIHYTTNKKPWNSPDFELSEKWWQIARKTSVYEKIIYEETLFKPMKAFSGFVFALYNFNKIFAKEKANILKIYRERLKKNY